MKNFWPWRKKSKPTEEEKGPFISRDGLKVHDELVTKFKDLLSEKALRIATAKSKSVKIVVMPEDVQTAYKQIIRPGL